MLRTVLLVALACALGGYASIELGVSQAVNGAWQDGLHQAVPRSETHAPVVLVEGDTAVEIDKIAAAARSLRAAGVRQVGIMAGPAQARQLERIFADEAAVVVAWPARRAGDVAGRWEVPSGAAPGAPAFALAAGAGPPYRTQPLAITTRRETRLTLEAALAGVAGEGAGRYYIDYRGGSARLPQIPLSEAARGDLLASVVQGRTALIATTGAWTAPLLQAPVAGAGLTGAQVHALALRTLLEGRPLGVLPAWLAALGLLGGGILAGGLAVLLGGRVQPLYMLGLLGVAVAATVGAFVALGLVIPGVELAVALILPAVAVAIRRERDEDRLLARLVGAARTRARERDRSAQEDDEGAWQLIARLVAENLNMSRAVFLELPQDGTHLHSIAGVNADGSAIAERRRDVRRRPYTEATTPNAPMEVAYPYLSAADDAERQFLVPLSFGGRTLGFWAFATPAGTDPAEEGTLAAVPVFAERAAELLYLERDPARDQRGWRRWLAGAGQKPLSTELAQSLRVTERQTTLLEAVLARLTTAVAVFDIYGRPMHANRAMADLGHERGFQPYRGTATDLLVALGGFSRERARAFHRQAAMGAEDVYEPLATEIAGKRYMLSVTGLAIDELGGEDGSGVEAAPASRMAGVLIALSDYTSAANLFQLTEALGRFVNTRLRNDLGNIQLASGLLVDPRLSPERREHAADLITRAIQRADDELEMLDYQFVQAASDEQASAYPLDPVLVLRRALEAVQPEAAERSVAVRFEPPALSAPAMALPEELHAVLRAAAALVIDAARPGAEMAVRYDEDSRVARITLEAPGFGMSNDRLQQVLEHPERDEPEVARILRAGKRQLSEWGGELDAHAGVGEGARVTVVLRRALRASETAEAT